MLQIHVIHIAIASAVALQALVHSHGWPSSDYRQTSRISRTKSENLNVPRLVLPLSLPDPLNPGVNSRMKM